MKIVALVENTTKKEQYPVEHGLSLYLEMKEKKFLFDLGGSSLFLENAKRLCIPIEEVEFAVISHGHYDHGGGLDSFLKANSKAKIYLSHKAFGSYYAQREQGKKEYIGLNPELKENPRFIFTTKFFQIDRGLELFSGRTTEELYSSSNSNLMEKKEDGFFPDSFFHEQSMIITEGGKMVLLAGCAHNGIVNIINRVIQLKGTPPNIVIGGFHLSRPHSAEKEEVDFVREVGRRLSQFGSQYYTCHCTGENAFSILKKEMGDSIHYLRGGMELKI